MRGKPHPRAREINTATCFVVIRHRALRNTGIQAETTQQSVYPASGLLNQHSAVRPAVALGRRNYDTQRQGVWLRMDSFPAALREVTH